MLSVFSGVAAAFAYEGWSIATSINSELKNSKKHLPIALVVGTLIIMAVYIPIFFMFMVKEGKNHIFKNIIMPLLGIIASLFMVFVAFYAHGLKPYRDAAANGEFAFPVLFYLTVFAVIMIFGAFFYRKKEKNNKTK